MASSIPEIPELWLQGSNSNDKLNSSSSQKYVHKAQIVMASSIPSTARIVSSRLKWQWQVQLLERPELCQQGSSSKGKLNTYNSYYYVHKAHISVASSIPVWARINVGKTQIGSDGKPNIRQAQIALGSTIIASLIPGTARVMSARIK